jgi:signal transduction histidine kinase
VTAARARWSIRTRTAVAFGGLFMVLATAVLVFVNVMAQRGIVTVLEVPGGAVATPVAASASPARSVAASAVPSGGALPVRSGQAGVTRVGRVVASQQWSWSAVGVGAAGLVAACVGWVVARAMLRPIEVITATAERISATTLDERIDLGGPDDEVKRLADTIDALFGRLEQAFEGQRRFVAQASHELRTPLALQRAAIQIGLDDGADPTSVRAVREELLAANRRSEQLVEGLLDLAEAERGLGDRARTVDLAVIAADVVAGLGERGRAAGLDLRLHADRVLRTTADPVLVRHMLENLVDNALEYNRPGGRVDVTVDTDGVTVMNTGPVVSAAEATTLTTPFARLDGQRAEAPVGVEGAAAVADHPAPRRHSGIGLSVVAAVARAHGWRLVITPRPEGGLVVRVAGVSPM